MPFTAILDGKRVNSLDFTDSDWDDLKLSQRANRTLLCPSCSGLLSPRSGSDLHFRCRPHFYHLSDFDKLELASDNPKTLTPCIFQKNVSQEHYYLVQVIYDMLVSAGHKPETEYRIGKRWADIALPHQKKVIEIQLSNQAFMDYHKRTSDYNSDGYDVLWIVWKTNYGGMNLPHAILDLSRALSESQDSPNNRNSILSVIPSGFDVGVWVPKFGVYDKKVYGCRHVIPLEKMVLSFASDTIPFVSSCSCSDFPHWCGYHCREAFARKEEVSSEIVSEGHGQDSYDYGLDFYDYSGMRRSFNVRLYANDIWIGNYPSLLERHYGLRREHRY